MTSVSNKASTGIERPYPYMIPGKFQKNGSFLREVRKT
jgi:hypothetical protein